MINEDAEDVLVVDGDLDVNKGDVDDADDRVDGKVT